MATYKLVCSDLDGTLLDSHGAVSPENLRAVEALAEKGVFFVPTTGRSFSELPEELRDTPFIRWYICSNGAMVLDKQTGESHLTGIAPALARQVLEILSRYEAHLTLRDNGKCYVDETYATAEAFDYYNVWEAHRTVVNEYAVWHQDFARFCETAAAVEVIAACFHDRDEMLAARKAIESLGGLRVVNADEYALEIMNADAGKGNALGYLCERLGIAREESIAVGDSDNDGSMIRAAGLGLAVANACESLKEAADTIICSNNEHAVRYIEKTYV